MPRFYLTSPVYYVNGRPHIGSVYTTLVADVIARWQRGVGDAVFFLTGTDEHAAKVADSAAVHGLTPLAWADENAAAFQEAFAAFGIANDDFILAEAARLAAWCLWPFMPAAATEAHRRLSGREPDRGLGSFGAVPPGMTVTSGPPLFPRVQAAGR